MNIIKKWRRRLARDRQRRSRNLPKDQIVTLTDLVSEPDEKRHDNDKRADNNNINVADSGGDD